MRNIGSSGNTLKASNFTYLSCHKTYGLSIQNKTLIFNHSHHQKTGYYFVKVTNVKLRFTGEIHCDMLDNKKSEVKYEEGMVEGKRSVSNLSEKFL